MGSDDLHHKRKARKVAELARHKAKRAPYAKVLIVCEGEKTEPAYFEELKEYYGLSSANVEVCGKECGSAPINIVNFAKERFRKEKNAGDAFDRVYCVFDKDTHKSYQPAIDQVNRFSPKGIFFTITSVPCFEYWLILHFQYWTKPYEAMPGNSAGNQVLKDLKVLMSEYKKGNKGIFFELIGQLEFAKNNAQRSLHAAQSAYTDNPSTRVHELVDFLQNIKSKKSD